MLKSDLESVGCGTEGCVATRGTSVQDGCETVCFSVGTLVWVFVNGCGTLQSKGGCGETVVLIGGTDVSEEFVDGRCGPELGVGRRTWLRSGALGRLKLPNLRLSPGGRFVGRNDGEAGALFTDKDWFGDTGNLTLAVVGFCGLKEVEPGGVRAEGIQA